MSTPSPAAPPTTPGAADLRTAISALMLTDQQRLQRRLDGAARIGDAGKRDRALAEIAVAAGKAEARVARRAAAVPAVTYPAGLPVSARRTDIADAIRDHQVVIVAGETGSGKTTQLPKICLELGRGVRGMIGHTQPRRIAARTVAERIATELDTPLGAAIGWKVRFTDQVSDQTLVKVMTDGILLAETQTDRDLRRYDTIIIDEAHERSLNIDFLLGYLKQLLPRRPELKVIITSATIDPERFAAHFDKAPIVEVSGRTYPVEVRYRPVVDPDDPDADPDRDRDQVQAICDAVDELRAEPRGDVLVFCSGEREIRDTADALSAMQLADTEVLPLYSRLAAAEQHRVFQAHRGRRVVLSTNVAETSLTVPGIGYVVDPGTARISRYSYRTKVQRLPIEPISQASANQRAGRCGRTSDGICIRLYSEDDFRSRPEYTDPEILRTNLAAVILQMAAAGLGEIARFPFLDPPDRRSITDGVNLLVELGGIDPSRDARHRLTPLGRQLAQLPADPRLARMILEAGRLDCVREVLVVAAALSIQDPRERPADAQQRADQSHSRFADKTSDFASYLNLWRHLQDQQRALSGNQFRRLCRSEYLNYLRIREWQDLESQLRQVAKSLGLHLSKYPAAPQVVHTALLAGLLSHIGIKDEDSREFLGARGTRFAIFPGSALFKKPPRWVVAAELVETSRLWGRVAARIEPEWVEPLAAHLVNRSYAEPHWEKKRAAVMATEKVTLYGVPLVTGRRVDYAKVDPQLCRELFIRHALVEGDWDTHHAFFRANRDRVRAVQELEERTRRRDLLVGDDTLEEFYAERIPRDVVSGRHFDAWWKKACRQHPTLLDFSPALLVAERADAVEMRDFPDTWRIGDLEVSLQYEFEPGQPGDGVTADLPLAALNRIDPSVFGWQVPGFREDLAIALIRTLPKHIRTGFVPAPDWACRALATMTPYDGSFPAALARALRQVAGSPVDAGDFTIDRVPPHLGVGFRVVGDDGVILAEGKDLHRLRADLQREMQASLSAAAAGVETTGLRDFTVDALPRQVEQDRAGHTVTAFPALTDEGDSVAVRLYAAPDQAAQAMWLGTRRLVLLGVPSPVKAIVRRLPAATKLALAANPEGDVPALLTECVAAAADKLIADAGGPAWDRTGFAALRDRVSSGLQDTAVDVVAHVGWILSLDHALDARTAADQRPIAATAIADIAAQRRALVYPGFVTATGYDRLPDIERYLRAIEVRLDKLAERPERDAAWSRRVASVLSAFTRTHAAVGDSAELTRIRWMIEELRVSLFAQSLGTPYAVSDARILRALDSLRR